MTVLNPTFAKLGVRDEIVRALAEEGKEHTFAIQELTLPLALAGEDLIGQARTGLVKTLAFGVPMLQRITTDTERPLSGIPRALVVVPTRELCLPVFGALCDRTRSRFGRCVPRLRAGRRSRNTTTFSTPRTFWASETGQLTRTMPRGSVRNSSTASWAARASSSTARQCA